MPDQTDIKAMDYNVIEDMTKYLASFASTQESILNLMKKQREEEIKEKVQEPVIEEVQAEEPSKVEEEIGALRKVFRESMSSVKDFLSPGGMLKSFGLLSGSPIFMLIGDKLDDLIGKYKEFSAEQKKQTDTSFLQEQQRDEDLNFQKQQINLLQEIADKELTVDTTKKSFLDAFKKPLELFTKTLPGALGGILGGGGILGRMTGVGRGSAGVKGKLGRVPKGLGKVGGLLKGGGRLLGKAALPLALITGGIDFAQGWRDALEITGREDIMGKIQAGLSSVVSGLTFGLVDPKSVSNSVDFVVEKLKNFFTRPIEIIKDVFKGKDILGAIKNVISERVSKLTFGLVSPETVSNSIDLITGKLKNFFMAPFNLIKDIVKGEDILGSISEYVSDITFGLIGPETVSNMVNFVTTKLKDFFMSPFNLIKDVFKGKDILESISNFVSDITFGWIDPEEIKKRINGAIDNIKNKAKMFKDIIAEKFESLVGMITSPFEAISGMFKSAMDKITGADETKAPSPGKKTFKIGDDEEVLKKRKSPLFSFQSIKGLFDKSDIKPAPPKETTLDRIRQERINVMRREREKTIVREKETKERQVAETARSGDNIITNNQNMIVQEKITSRSDDTDWLRSSHF
jgi:hypothetical protein